jgi:hypothetical protein
MACPQPAKAKFASSSRRLAWTLLGDYISGMCGRVIQSSGPLRYAIVDGMNVRDSRVDEIAAGSTTAMPTTPRPTGNSPPKMLASNLSIYTLQSD